MTYPAKHILNPAFRYRNAANTNIAETFERIRKEIAREQRKTQREKKS